MVTELLKHLRYRYELSERALVHHAKLAADAMLGKAIAMWRDALWVEAALSKYPREVKRLDLEDLAVLVGLCVTDTGVKRWRISAWELRVRLRAAA